MARGVAKKTVAEEASEAFFQILMDQRNRFQAISAEIGLTPPQAGTLYHIGFSPNGLAMSALANTMHCDPSNVTGIVDKLEARRLVERRASEGDRRVKRLVLTAEGVRLRDKLSTRLMQPAEWMLKLPAADQRALRDILVRAAAMLEDPAAAARSA
jgi:MarR family transcriptional regulator, organic hydroperoxide resistance regulator